MTSKISLFSIMKGDIRHKLWMVALSFLGSFLALPILLLMLLSRTDSNFSYSENLDFRITQSVLHFFNENILLSGGFVAFVGALIVGLLGFSFLYSKKKVDFFHSIPIKRSKIFIAYYLNGILIWLLPYLINLFFAIIIGVSKLNDITSIKYLFANVIKSSILLMFSFLVIYHLCLVCVMISGNFFNALISTIILGFSVIGIYGLVLSFCTMYFKHFMQLPFVWDWDRIVWASPLASAFLLLSKVDTPFMKLACLILMIVNLVLAWRLYLNRPSELAEQGIQNKRIQGFLRIIGTYSLTLSGALLGYLINYYFTYNYTSKHIGWSIFGMILMSIIFGGIFNVIFNMNFKTFFKNKIQFIITTGFALLTFLSISGDWYGFDLRIPDKDNIKGGTFYMSSYSDGVRQSQYQNTLEFSDIQNTDVDSIYPLLNKLVRNSKDDGYPIYVTLNLENGSTFYRKYQVLSEDKELLRPIIEDESYKNANYPLSAGLGLLPTTEYIIFEDSNHKSTHEISDEATIKKLENAYREDFEEHYNLDELKNAPVVGSLHRRYSESGSERSHPSELIYSNYTHTIAILQELQPNMVFTIDDVNTNSINFDIHIDDLLPKEALYSYFGLEGYPDYKGMLYDKYNMSSSGTENVAVAVPQEKVGNGLYKKIISDEKSIQELLPYLILGDYYSSTIFDNDYISIGYIISENNSYTCFVEKGKLPKKWIDLLMEQ